MIIKSSKLYDWLKWAGRYFLPGLSAFVFTLSEILGIHDLAVASAIISALVVFLNTLLGQSNETYKIDTKNQMFDAFIKDVETEIRNKEKISGE